MDNTQDIPECKFSSNGLTPDQWIAAGYNKFKNNGIINEYSDYGLQKLFSDFLGKQYYLTVYVYENFNKDYYAKYNGAILPYSFSPDVQFTPDGKMTLHVQFGMDADTTIEDVENQVRELWVSVGSPYYELWN